MNYAIPTNEEPLISEEARQRLLALVDEYREASGMSDYKIAQSAGLSPQYIAEFLRGGKSFATSKADKLELWLRSNLQMLVTTDLDGGTPPS